MVAKFFIILSFFLLLAAGCSTTTEPFQPSENDLDRVANILKQSKVEIKKITSFQSNWRAPKLSEARISFGDALALGECGLIPLIADRNSALGKQKPESIQFIYEWKLMHGLRTCNLAIKQEQWFRDILAVKSQDLNTAALLVLTRSDESVKVRSQRSTGLTLHQSMSVYNNAFTQIRQLILQANNFQEPPTKKQISDFESALKEFASSHHHGRLGQAIRYTSAWLDGSILIQTKALRENKICPMGTPTQMGKDVQAFVRGYLANEILPRFAKIIQAYQQLQNLWQPIIERYNLPPEFLNTEILRIKPSQFDQLTNQLKTHINLWQKVLQNCQLSTRTETMK